MLPKAILFDLDDTIISFDGAADTAWKIMCNSFVKEMNTSFDEEALLDSVNEVRTWYWSDPERHRVGRLDMIQARRDIVKKSLENLGYTDLESGWRMADNYSKLQDELICMFPDARIKKLGLDAGNVWMVGDNLTWDIEAPQKLGIYSIWNDHGKKGLLAQATVKPDRIINSISELIL
ncbi:MAG: putative phosphoglycolate phosphatase [Eubacterium sp.]|nr:putative phosphoglycolate phosphatase [Eubacterium sp.]